MKGRRKSSGFAREPHEHYVEAEWCSARLFADLTAPGSATGIVEFGDAIRDLFDVEAAKRFRARGMHRGFAEAPALLPDTVILDPACGFGHVVRAARLAGLKAVGTDLVKRAPGMCGGRDFLKPAYRRPAPGAPLAIVCNPPFDQIREFTEKALGIADELVCVLFPSNRFAAARWLRDLPLRKRLALTPRPSMWPGAMHTERVAKGLPLRNGRADFEWLIFRPGGTYAGVSGWLEREGAR